MECGIVGPPLSGKTTLFNLLTGACPPSGSVKREVQRGVAKLPDFRLAKLAALSASRKIVPATVEYVDVPGVEVTPEKREPYPAAYLAELRGAAMLTLTIRDFAAPAIPHPRGRIDPAADLADAALEFIVNDLSTVEKRLAKISRLFDPASKKETELLERCKQALDAGTHLRALQLEPEEEKLLRGYAFLSLKPLLVVLNVGEEAAADSDARLASLKEAAGDLGGGVGWAACAAGIEAEIAQLEESERAPFMEELGFDQPALDRIVRAAFDLLGLITFFTTSEKDTTAWAVRRGSNAVTAAGAIHEDIARGFIRAEVFGWDEFVAAEGSHARLKETGKLRLEGKDYIVHDGDIINVRFSG